MNKFVFFDLDGVLVDLFHYPNYRELMDNENIEPYKNASPMFNKEEIKVLVDSLKSKGYSIGIISFVGKKNSLEYAKRVKETKLEWIKKYFPYAEKIIIANPNNSKKSDFINSANDYLVDDSRRNIDEWKNKGGKVIKANPKKKNEFYKKLMELD